VRAVFRELPSWSRATTVASTRSCPAPINFSRAVFDSFTWTRTERPARRIEVGEVRLGLVTSSSPAAKYPDAGLRDACDRRLSGE
jgi:hypothetical protein